MSDNGNRNEIPKATVTIMAKLIKRKKVSKNVYENEEIFNKKIFRSINRSILFISP